MTIKCQTDNSINLLLSNDILDSFQGPKVMLLYTTHKLNMRILTVHKAEQNACCNGVDTSTTLLGQYFISWCLSVAGRRALWACYCVVWANRHNNGRAWNGSPWQVTILTWAVQQKRYASSTTPRSHTDALPRSQWSLPTASQQVYALKPDSHISLLQRVRIARNADRCNSQTDSVCRSVCLLRACVLSRQMKIQSCGF